VDQRISGLDLASDHLTIEVVDKDWLTGNETLIAVKKKTSIDIRKWLGNKSFEGKIDMDDGKGSIQVVVKAFFPSFMCTTPSKDNPASQSFAVSNTLDCSLIKYLKLWIHMFVTFVLSPLLFV
jgi:hypothetical protein